MPKSLSLADARQRADRCLDLVRRYNACVERTRLLTEQSEAEVRSFRAEKRDQLLAAVRVARSAGGVYEEVRDPDAPGLDLYVLSKSDLDSDIPLKSQRAEARFGDCKERALEGSRIQLDPRQRTFRTSAVLLGVYRASAAKGAISSRNAEAELLRDECVPLAQSLKKLPGTVRWLFTPREDKEAAADAYGRLSELLDDRVQPSVDALESELRALDSVPEHRPWDWLADHREDAEAGMEAASPGVVGEDRWPFTAQQARGLVARAERLCMRMGAEEGPSEALRLQVEESVERRLGEELLVELDRVPVEELNRGKQGIRVKRLVDAGYTTVRDVYASTASNLERIDGIGWQGAFDAKRRAEAIAHETEKGLKLRLSSDDQTPASTKVVAAVCAIHRHDALIGRLQGMAPRVREQADAADEALGDAQDGLAWLLADDEAIEGARSAYGTLEAFLAGDTCKEAERLLKEAARLEKGSMTPEEAWRAFEEDPARFFTTLEGIVPDAVGGGDGVYGLPEDLAREIQEECFFPDGLLCTLRRYQEWGVKYILHKERTLLGDEMGLGKTVQAIAAMVSLKNVGETHFLVVCPASVLENWCREVAKHSRLSVTKVHGRDCQVAFGQWLKSGGVAVTTYETTAKLTLPADFGYGIAVVDEAHYIKNPEAARTRNTRRLMGPARRVVLMTGTALENKVDEMLTLIDYLRPAVARKARPLAFMAGAPRFRDAVAPVYYRRKREDVLTELPDLVESEEWCTLGAIEKEAYERAVLTESFMAARRVSWNVPDLTHSCKARRLMEIVEEAEDENRKVLVFTFFLDTAAAVAKLLAPRCVGTINGSVPPAKRQAIVEGFEKAPNGSVLVAQINSAGTGMNIQCASVVVICEPQYKPSTETQAIARAYRMGQARSVLAYRLLCENTVDEGITELLKEKQAQFDAFADKSSAAAAAGEDAVAVDEKGMSKIIEAEIERIKRENPRLVATVERENAVAAKEAGPEPKALRRPEKTKPARAAERTPRAPRRSVETPLFCPGCGKRHQPDAAFCPYCGRRLDDIA